MKKIKSGSNVPWFELKDQDGNVFRLQDVLGRKNLVIFFYPKDNTTGCTAEACSFRDEYEQFLDSDAIVIGVSSDDEASHRNFIRNHNLPYTLLSDPDGKVRKLFGVPRSFFGLLPGRTTYIIDKKGIIRYIFNSQIDIRKHVETAIEVLKNISEN